MTLGKIERFWKTIWEEFLERAQFDSIESACERIRLWVKHCNQRRPHQSLEGLCPADRFFAIAQELRQVIERGIHDNVLELYRFCTRRRLQYSVGVVPENDLVSRTREGRPVACQTACSSVSYCPLTLSGEMISWGGNTERLSPARASGVAAVNGSGSVNWSLRGCSVQSPLV